MSFFSITVYLTRIKLLKFEIDKFKHLRTFIQNNWAIFVIILYHIIIIYKICKNVLLKNL